MSQVCFKGVSFLAHHCEWTSLDQDDVSLLKATKKEKNEKEASITRLFQKKQQNSAHEPTVRAMHRNDCSYSIDRRRIAAFDGKTEGCKTDYDLDENEEYDGFECTGYTISMTVHDGQSDVGIGQNYDEKESQRGETSPAATQRKFVRIKILGGSDGGCCSERTSSDLILIIRKNMGFEENSITIPVPAISRE